LDSSDSDDRGIHGCLPAEMNHGQPTWPLTGMTQSVSDPRRHDYLNESTVDSGQHADDSQRRQTQPRLLS
jgi:hypothetical protein